MCKWSGGLAANSAALRINNATLPNNKRELPINKRELPTDQQTRLPINKRELPINKREPPINKREDASHRSTKQVAKYANLNEPPRLSQRINTSFFNSRSRFFPDLPAAPKLENDHQKHE
jgi:hypothetical protein